MPKSAKLWGTGGRNEERTGAKVAIESLELLSAAVAKGFTCTF
jgi:hypothetical protein